MGGACVTAETQAPTCVCRKKSIYALAKVPTERVFWGAVGPACCSMLTRSRPQWPTLVLFFVGCLGFDYQVTIEPTIDPGSVGGDVSTVAGGFNRPGGSPGCYGNGRIYMSDTGNHVIKSVDRGSGAVNTEAGKKGVKGLVDGRGGDAAFYNPQGVAVGPDDTCACPPLVASRQRTTDKHARPRARLQCTSPTRSSTDPAHTMHMPCTCHACFYHLLSRARRQCTLPT